MEEEFTKVAH